MNGPWITWRCQNRKTPLKRLACGMGLLLLLTGCQGMGTASLSDPGTTDAQRNRAVRFDPYAEADIGTPVDGARPREYEKPIAEPLRARWPILGENRQ